MPVKVRAHGVLAIGATVALLALALVLLTLPHVPAPSNSQSGLRTFVCCPSVRAASSPSSGEGLVPTTTRTVTATNGDLLLAICTVGTGGWDLYATVTDSQTNTWAEAHASYYSVFVDVSWTHATANGGDDVTCADDTPEYYNFWVFDIQNAGNVDLNGSQIGQAGGIGPATSVTTTSTWPAGALVFLASNVGALTTSWTGTQTGDLFDHFAATPSNVADCNAVSCMQGVVDTNITGGVTAVTTTWGVSDQFRSLPFAVDPTNPPPPPPPPPAIVVSPIVSGLFDAGVLGTIGLAVVTFFSRRKRGVL